MDYESLFGYIRIINIPHQLCMLHSKLNTTNHHHLLANDAASRRFFGFCEVLGSVPQSLMKAYRK